MLNQNLYQTVVTSYTKGSSYELTMSQNYVTENDHVLIVDDFLANGEAATAPSAFCARLMQPSQVLAS